MIRQIALLAILGCSGVVAADGQGMPESSQAMQLVVSQVPLQHQQGLRRDLVATSINDRLPSMAGNVDDPLTTSVAASSRRTVVDSMFDSLSDLPANITIDEELRDEVLDSDMQDTGSPLMPSWESWTSPERIVGSIRVVAIMAALSLAPALLLMTTCYIRLVVVLGLLRHALGSQQLPPQQVITTLAMFLTVLIMWPVWNRVHEDAIEPYSNPEVEMSAEEAWSNGVAPIRSFMIGQIQRAGNGQDVAMFLEYLDVSHVSSNAEIPLQALLPAFLISELKIAFLIGFQIYLPFLLLDLVVSSVTMSMGMVMVPPTTISLPLKLIMFVLVDGWHLVIEMLLTSFSSA